MTGHTAHQAEHRAAERHPERHPERRAEHRAPSRHTALTGVGPLIRFVLRRDRIYLPVWVVSIITLTWVSAAAVRRTYDTPVEIASYAVNVGGSPASVAIGGPPVALHQIGGILIYETSLTALLGVALMATFTVVRHTRREEDAGRVELLGSTVVDPHAVITAAVLVSAGASLLVGAGVAASFVAEEQPLGESLLYAAAVASLGVVFTAVAACAAQLMSHARGAIGVSVAFLGVAFGLRAIGDVNQTFWSWLSPMGWSQQVRVYADNRWWPLALSLALTGLLVAATIALEGRRDLGAGIVPSRAGRADAPRSLSGVTGLGWRLQRGALIAWVVGVWSMGLLLGSFSEALQDMVKDNPTLKEYLSSSGMDFVQAFLATCLLLLAIGGSGFAVSSALRTHAEETADRLEPVLATAVSRSRWLFGSLLVTLLGTTAVVASGGLGVGISYAATTGRPSEVWRMTAYSLVHLPAVLVLVAAAVLLLGWAPRASGAVWALLGLCFVIGWLGSLIDPPQWVKNLSPFTHVPAVPAVDVTATPLVVLLAVSVAAVAAGWAGFLRRDVG